MEIEFLGEGQILMIFISRNLLLSTAASLYVGSGNPFNPKLIMQGCSKTKSFGGAQLSC